jgi:ferredoxin-NADP reductase
MGEGRTLRVVSVRDETQDVRTIRLSTLGRGFDFVPGQYCLVSMAGSEEARPFTFASSPTETDYIELTVKRMGEFTAALHRLNPGDSLKVDGPMGESLNFDDSIREDVVFIAGGSGITPFMSALRYAGKKGLPNGFTLLFSSREEGDIIYNDELRELQKRGNMTIINTLTQGKPKGWKGENGRIDADMVKRHVKDLKSKLWYICGPPPMVDSVKGMLIGLGVPEEKIRWEDWQIRGKHDKEVT